ncbi:MAG: 50S ribosomal protein L17 [Candidatus Paceibacterota bacterium]
MRHRVKTKQFNRDTNHRKMLVRNLVRSLVEHGEIVTTEAKAKETKRWADKLIGKAQKNTVATKRQLHTFFGTREVVNTLVDKIAPAMGKRVSGFSRIVKLGKRRGDNTELVKLSLVEQVEKIGTLKSGLDHAKRPAKSKKAVVKKAVSAKKVPTKKAPAKKVSAKKPSAKKSIKTAKKSK